MQAPHCLIDGTSLRAWREERRGLCLEFLSKLPQVGCPGAGGEQDLADISVSLEDLAAALHEASVVDSPEHPELLRTHAAEEAVQGMGVEPFVARPEQRALVSLAPGEFDLAARRQTETRPDAELAVGVQEGVIRLPGDAVEERVKRTERRALARLVRTEDHVQAVAPPAQVEHTAGERTERGELEIEDLHRSASARVICAMSSSRASATSRARSSGACGSTASSPDSSSGGSTLRTSPSAS